LVALEEEDMLRSICVRVAALSLGFSSAALADETVLLGASRDNTLYESADGSLSSGGGITLFAGRTNQPAGLSLRRGLLNFDVAASLPAGAVITDVALTLYSDQFSNTQDETVSVHRLLADWGEGDSVPPGGGLGGPAATGDATWLHTFYPSQTWTSPGGDFVSGASASAIVGGAGFYVWSSPQMIADVQLWIDTPGSAFGWLLAGNESAARSAKRFATREEATPEWRPLLRVNWIPEPGTAGLSLLAASLAARVRRRRAAD
jgi:hypothetical protein